ncbi:oxidoreductase [Algimonas arctica]|uniref:Oxidoreductase n=1 Tax=Algimonas arctica TaxID=1479486 RepID=A0A8J3G3N4_9PROT|nr:FAD-binding oxidoreductase [Algimonas arctica]GHB05562.1 oxidoreductase [Algimonas arctica]
MESHSRTFARDTLWEHTSPPGPKLGVLTENIKSDVVVIGGGVAGLSTALHLAEAGCSVTVIEAAEIGGGATGKSGGLMAPDFIRHGPDDIEKDLGEEWGQRLIQMVGRSTFQCFDLIEKYGISCDHTRDGFWTPAHNSAVADRLEDRVHQWKVRGFNVEYKSRVDTCEKLGSTKYCGAMYFADGGAVNPLALARGLADVALAKGAKIYAQSPVTQIKKQPGGWRVITKHGVINANRIVLAANGGNAALHHALKKTVLPLDVYEYASAPLSDLTRSKILPKGGSYTDKQPYMFTARYDASGRLIAALPDFFIKRSERDLIQEAKERLQDHFPILEGVSIEYIWKGRAWLNSSLLPKVYGLEEGAYAIQACNGRGLANNIVLGKELAAALTSGDMNELSVRVETARGIRGFFVAKYTPSFLMALAYMRHKLLTLRQRRKDK